MGKGIFELPQYCFFKNTSLEKIYLPETTRFYKANKILTGSNTEVYGFTTKNVDNYCSSNSIVFHDISDHTHTLKDHIFYSDEEILIQGKYCEECGYGTETSFLLQSEVDSGKTEEEVLTYSLDGNNMDEQEIVYTLNNIERTATVGEDTTSKSNASNYEGLNDGTVVIPERVEKGGDIYTVTRIGSSCFRNNEVIQSLYLPASIKEIGTYPLKYCPNLKEIHVDNGNPYFMSEDGVLFARDKKTLYRYPAAKTGKVYQIPEQVKFIGEYAFEGCQLYEVIFPKKIEEIQKEAFYESKNIKYLDLRHVKSIGYNAFCNDENVKSVLLSPNVVIDSQAFWKCGDLEAIFIPQNAKVGRNAFYYCKSLKTVIMDEGSILSGIEVFLNCYGMENMILPKDLVSIPEKTFYDCFNKKLYLPESVQKVPKSAIYKSTKVYGKPFADSENISEFIDISDHTHVLKETVFFENEYEKIAGSYCSECGYAENCTHTIYLEESEELPTPTVTPATTPSVSPSPTPSGTPTMTAEPTLTPTPEVSESPSPTVAPEPTMTAEPIVTPTPEPEESMSPAPSQPPIVTVTPTPEPIVEPSESPSPTVAPEPTMTVQPIVTPTPTLTPTPEASESPSPTVVPEPTMTAEPTLTPTPEPSMNPSPGPGPTPIVPVTPTPEPEESMSPSPSQTPIVTVPPTPEPIVEPSESPSPTEMPEPSSSPSPTPTMTAEPIVTPTPEPIVEPEPSPSPSQTPIEPNLMDDKLVSDEEPKITSIPKEKKNLVISGFRLSSKDNRAVVVRWKKNPLAQSYHIYRSDKKKGGYQRIRIVNRSRSSYVDKGAKPLKRYYYKIVPVGTLNENEVEGKETAIRSIKITGIGAPKIAVKKGRQEKIRYITVFMKRYQGKYAEIQISRDGKTYKNLELVSNEISRYQDKIKIQCLIKNQSIWLKVRTFNKKGRKKIYSDFCKEIKIKL